MRTTASSGTVFWKFWQHVPVLSVLKIEYSNFDANTVVFVFYAELHANTRRGSGCVFERGMGAMGQCRSSCSAECAPRSPQGGSKLSFVEYSINSINISLIYVYVHCPTGPGQLVPRRTALRRRMRAVRVWNNYALRAQRKWTAAEYMRTASLPVHHRRAIIKRLVRQAWSSHRSSSPPSSCHHAEPPLRLSHQAFADR